ncbi:hypothetical protein [Flavobacterium sp.]|uniref:hypothetical protein n=1 Tax=Flavobacterium sp. TaxID=239 RepID=UPI003750D5DE
MKNSISIVLLISICFFSCKKESGNNPSIEPSAVENHSNISQEGFKSDTPQKETNSTNQKAKKMNRDQRMIGTWRHTEVISSGSGEFYASMTTDDFMEFKANGIVTTWVGTAAAGNADMTFENKEEGNAQEGLWKTNDSHTQVTFTDPISKQEATTNYFLEDTHLMFSNGNSKKVYEKIN